MLTYAITILTTLSMIFFISSCSKSDPPIVNESKIVVEWGNGLTLKSTEYRLNGELIGRGEKAFDVLLAKLNDLPSNRIILFREPRDIAFAVHELEGDVGFLPFPHESEARAKFDVLCEQKHLIIETEMYDPIEYLSPDAIKWLQEEKSIIDTKK